MKEKSPAARLWGNMVRAASKLFPESHMLQVSEYRVTSQKIPEAFNGYKIVQLSDLHGCSFGRGNRRLIQKINSVSPNLVVMTGDMADRLNRTYEKLFRFSKTLCEKYRVFYITGNHEQELTGQKRTSFLDGMRRQGVEILDNSAADLERGGAKIHLYGFRIPMKYYRSCGRRKRRPKLTAEKIERKLGSCEKQAYSILLAHNPFYFGAFSGWGADLTLCGHVHGGMIRLPGRGGLLSPERSFFPQYSGGLYEMDGKKMIVSRGLASGARIFNRPEMVVITLFHFSAGCEGMQKHEEGI